MNAKKYRNILVVSLTNIGDVVLTLPTVNILRGNFPEADISIIVGPHPAELLKRGQGFKEVIVYNKKGALRDKIAFICKLRSSHFDLVVDLRNTTIPFLLMPISFNKPRIFKYPVKWSMRERHIAALSFLHLDHDLNRPVLLYDDTDKQKLISILDVKGIPEERLKSAVILAPSARTYFKTWPPEKFIALAKQINRAFPAKPIVLVGSRDERRVAEAIQGEVGRKAVSLAGEISLREYAALADSAGLLIANDSAAMHIGNYCQIPLIAVFGPTNYVHYGESSPTSTVIRRKDLPCIPCCGTSCDIGRVCLVDLPVDTVFNEVVRKLGS